MNDKNQRKEFNRVTILDFASFERYRGELINDYQERKDYFLMKR